MRELFHLVLVRKFKEISCKKKLIIDFFISDLSGLTLQSGPSRLVKDEYTPGPVVSGGLDLDGSEIGTIQHHPHQGQPGYGFPQGYYFLKTFLKLFIFLLHMILLL